MSRFVAARVALAIAALFAVSGCKFLKKSAPDAGAVTVTDDTDDDAGGDDAAAAAADAAPATTVHATAEEPLPTPTDEEKKATTELSGTNYKDELDKVEKDMQTEK